MKPIVDREAFKQLLAHGFTEAGCTHQLLSESAIELIRMASQGNPRQAHQLIVTSLRLATDKKINHLPDDPKKSSWIVARVVNVLIAVSLPRSEL